MPASLHKTKVDLTGLLEVLGKNLYSSPSVAIRELVQNAHDACMRDKYENVNSKGNYCIRITTNDNTSCVTIEDNGSGLTGQEIISYLATVGSGYTRQIRNENDTTDLIGYFGLGFLSAYVIAEKVEIWTASYQDESKGWYFSSRGGEQFSLLEIDPQPQGSKVLLHLKDGYHDLTDSYFLETLLKKYCCLLPVDIKLNDADEPLNDLVPPWLSSSTTSSLALKKQQLSFASIFEEYYEPICVFPLKDNNIKTQGLIWIRDSSGFSASDYRNVFVFIRNMYITHKAQDLLPQWAGFVGCIINSESLTPTASRESVQTDDYYHKLRKIIEESLFEGIKNLVLKEKNNWRRVLRRHNEALLGAAVSNPDIFERIADYLKVPTSEGYLTLKALLKRSENKIYLQVENQVNYEMVLFKAKMIPLVSGYFFAVSTFCHIYAKNRGVQLISLGTRQGNKDLFSPVINTDREKKALEKLFCQEQEVLMCTEFDPDYIPIILIEDQDILLKQRLESDEADERIGSAVLGLARQYTKTIDDSVKRRVFVNMKSSLIHRLLNVADGRQQLIANMLRSFIISLSHGGSSLGERQFAKELKVFSASLEKLTE